MVVAIIKAYVEWLNLPLGEYDIASLAYKIEREDLNLLGGKQDQYAATFGGFNFMEFYDNNRVIVNPLRLKRWIRNELENSLSLENMHALKYLAIRMKEAVLKGDFEQFAYCLLDGWKKKKNSASVISNPLIEKTYTYIIENGATAAKISGAGGGGFMMIYCDPVRRMQLLHALKRCEGTVVTTSFTEIGTQAWTLY